MLRSVELRGRIPQNRRPELNSLNCLRLLRHLCFLAGNRREVPRAVALGTETLTALYCMRTTVLEALRAIRTDASRACLCLRLPR